MARLKRFCPVGIAQHVIQRGNNRQVCFNGDEDFGSRGQTRMALS
jgi:putative transposase